MKFRILSLSLLALLAACNEDSKTPAAEGTFAPDTALTAPIAAAPAKPLTPEETQAAAYAAVAPKDTVVDEKTYYNTTLNGSVALADVNETASAKYHTMTIDGKTVHFTARAGHLVAYNAAAGKEAEAAIFYTAYTRDDLPKEKRPVTFFWNGGPGSASIWLHMGSWAPKRLKSDAPNIPESDYAKQPESFPFLDNDITLLGQSDLVFVDPPGTGYSAAVAPHTNTDFWGTDIDAQVVADFITRYNNVNNRQSSPKYLYGESYGGIRTPIVANLLQRAGTSRFEPDNSGKPAVVLSGYILNSPLVDYTSNCAMTGLVSCAGYIPSYAMAADYFHESIRTTESQADFLTAMKRYTRDVYTPLFNKYVVNDKKDTWTEKATKDGAVELQRVADSVNADWMPFTETKEGKDFLNGLISRIAANAPHLKSRLQPPLQGDGSAPFLSLDPNFDFNIRYIDLYLDHPEDGTGTEIQKIRGFITGRFDARMRIGFVGTPPSYSPDDYINIAFLNQFKSYLPDFANFSAASDYQPLNRNTIDWVWKRAGQTSNYPISIPDIQSALIYDPKLKLLILHGYEDIATPGYQTELDLEGAGLLERIPVKWFEGGHMTYNTEASRPLLKKTLDQYYEDKPYDAETALMAQTVQQSKVVSASRLVPAAAN